MSKISAVMALYNTPIKYLQKTVESILNQTFKDFELIVIDDASTIEYKELFEQFNDDRIKYFKLEKNAGPGKARNEGIKKAMGEYIAIVDSDDIYLPKRFEIQSKFFDENPEISLTSTTFRFSNRKKAAYIPLEDDEIKTFMLFNSPLCNPSAMFRRKEFLQQNLFYPEDRIFGEDYSLWINAMFAGIKMANLQDLLMIYTRRKGQLSREKQENQINALKKLYRKILEKIRIEATEEDLTLHYNIYAQNFSDIDSSDKITSWFDKIIEHNKKLNLFSEEKLIEKKNLTIKQYERAKNRLFKIKIGNYNFCVSKNFEMYIEKRE